MEVSEDGIRFIAKWEGYSPVVYRCSANKETIGYGHVIKPGETFPIPFTEPEARALLKEDAGFAQEAVERVAACVMLSQNQYDALVSLVFNIGAKAFFKSTLRKKLMAGDYAGAAEEFPKWKYAGGKVIQGLLNRRMAEKKLFES